MDVEIVVRVRQEDRELVHSAQRARLPWRSADAEEERRTRALCREDVETCMNCPLLRTPKYDPCNSCGVFQRTHITGRKRGRPKAEIDMELLRTMLDAGLGVNEMCAALGVGKSRLYQAVGEMPVEELIEEIEKEG